jgi:hypothetical protein
VSDIHVHHGPSVFARRIMYCPNCDHRRRFVGGVQEWYDTIWTCCTCGDSWTCEGMCARPFVRGWRQGEIARAKRNWGRAVTIAEAVERTTEHQ